MIEVAMVISNKGFPLCTVFGSAARVDFPEEYIWNTHKRYPGLIKIMAHSHPDGMNFMSEEDRTTLKAWTMALAPYTIYFDIVCYDNHDIKRKRYWYTLESLNEWVKRGKKGEREMRLQTMDMTGEYADWIRDLMSLSNRLD